MRKVIFCLIFMAVSAFFVMGFYSQQSADDVEQAKIVARNTRVSRAMDDNELARGPHARMQLHFLGKPRIAKVKCPRGKTLVVDSVNGPYSTIQDAVDAASDGDKIKIKAGTYSGFVVEDKNCLTIEGQRLGEVTISGSQNLTDDCAYTRDVSVFVHNSTNIELKKLTIIGGDTDDVVVWYVSSTGAINNCDISGTKDHVYGKAIRIEGCSSESSVDIKNCSVHDFGRVGIWVSSYDLLSPQTTARIENNDITGTFLNSVNRIQDGIWIDFSYAIIKNNEIRDCIASNVPIWDSNAIVVFGSTADTINNKLVNNWVGINVDVYTVDSVDIEDYLPEIYAKGNKIEDNNGTGIVLSNTINSVVENTSITGNDYGIYQINWGDITDLEVISYFNRCNIKGNSTDVYQDPLYGDCTLYFKRVKYDTYDYNDGTGYTATLNEK